MTPHQAAQFFERFGRMEQKLEDMHGDIVAEREAKAKLSARVASLEHFRAWVKGGAALLTTGLAVAAKAKGLF